MSLNNCTILFDKNPSPDPVFYSGESVSGTVKLTLNKDKRCDALMFMVSGMSKCSWMGSKGAGNSRRTVYYQAKEIYFEKCNNLLDNRRKTANSDLLKGDHSYKFSFDLPLNLPSSLKEEYGCVRYVIEITLKRSHKFDLSYKMCFTVLSLTNLNLIPEALLPILNESSKRFYTCFVSKGMLYMTIQIPLSGFVPGQHVPVKCILQNRSSIGVKAIKFVLKKKIIFICTHPKTKKTTIRNRHTLRTLTDGVENNQYSGETTLYIPPFPPSTLTLSSIIDVSYSLQVTAVASRLHCDLTSKIPIIIGTIPINNRNNLEAQLNTCSHEPSAPPIDYSDLPPPTYEEAMRQKSEMVMQEDEDWNNTNSYSPKYPVYNFNIRRDK